MSIIGGRPVFGWHDKVPLLVACLSGSQGSGESTVVLLHGAPLNHPSTFAIGGAEQGQPVLERLVEAGLGVFQTLPFSAFKPHTHSHYT